jgi:hypothetical protein
MGMGASSLGAVVSDADVVANGDAETDANSGADAGSSARRDSMVIKHPKTENMGGRQGWKKFVFRNMKVLLVKGRI